MTPLMTICSYSHLEDNIDTIKLLLEKGAYIDTKDSYGKTVLMLIAKSNLIIFEKILMLFIEYKTNLNIKEHMKGETLLHHLCVDEYQRCNSIIKILLDNGANPNIKNRCGKTALTKLLQITPTIMEDDDDSLLPEEEVKLKNEMKFKKWHENKRDLIKLLLNSKIDLNIKVKGKTQFEYICNYPDDEIVKYCFEKHNYYTLEIIQKCIVLGKHIKVLEPLAHALLYQKIGYSPTTN